MTSNIVGALGFTSKNNNFNSWAIRQYSKSDFSHVFVVIGEVYGSYIVLEADEGRVDINLISKYTMNKDMRMELYDLKLQGPSLDPAVRYILKKFQQTEYGNVQIIGFGLKAFGIQRNPFQKGMICSELAMEYLRMREMEDSFEDINMVDPEEVRQLIIENGAKLVCKKLYNEDVIWV